MKPTRRKSSNFINKDNLKANFAEIYDVAKMKDIYDMGEHRHHSPEANNVTLSSKVTIEFTIAILRKKLERMGCTFHLISVRVLEIIGDNVSGEFHSPKKKWRIGR